MSYLSKEVRLRAALDAVLDNPNPATLWELLLAGETCFRQGTALYWKDTQEIVNQACAAKLTRSAEPQKNESTS